MIEFMQLRAHQTGAVASFIMSVFWLVLAWRSPTSTHHFAPLIVAGAWGFMTRRGMLPAPSSPDRLLMFAGGLGMALATWLLLLVLGRLDGPALIEPIPVLVELPLMAVVGATIGSGAWCLVSRPQ